MYIALFAGDYGPVVLPEIRQAGWLLMCTATRLLVRGPLLVSESNRWVRKKDDTLIPQNALLKTPPMKYFFCLAAALGIAVVLKNPSNTTAGRAAEPVAQAVAVEHPNADGRIPIEPSRWYQVVNVSSGLEGLFNGKLDESVNTGWGKLRANYDAYYPLYDGEQMTIDQIRFYDAYDQNLDKPFTLSIITADWKRVPIAQFVGEQFMSWVGPDPKNQAEFRLKKPISGARYLVINTWGAYPSEMALYGQYVPSQTPRTKPLRRPIPFRQALGINMYEWNMEVADRSWEVDESQVPAIRNFSAVRHYMDWNKLEAKPGEYSYNLTLSGAWNYDAMYERLKAEKIEVLACLKTIPKWLENLYPPDQRNYSNNPVRYGADLTQPRSYLEQARVAFQYAARYGFNKAINPALVKVTNEHPHWAPVNVKKIGLGLVRYIECENERDKTWHGPQGYQTPREYAANLSAFYDGHKNTLGPGAGVKNADPNMTVVIGGLATSSTDYVRAMVDWCREFRGYRPDGRVNLCWDVINHHLYANDAKSSQSQTHQGTRGAAPEVAGVGEQARAFVQFSHDYCYDMPVWITETGYDTNPGSPFRAISIGKKSVSETQADWTLRTALLYIRMGIDHVFYYQMYDEDPNSATQFSSMGLINSQKKRKPATDYLYQTARLIGDYTYRQTISQNPTVDQYERVLPGGNRLVAYVLFIPDERGRTGTYQLSIPAGKTADVFLPKIGQDNMTKQPVSSLNGNLTLPVSETPLFVLIR